jgi:hypothetical protein
MGHRRREYLILPEWTDWQPGPNYNLPPNTSRDIEFHYDRPFAGSARIGAPALGVTPGPVEVEVKYLKNGETTVERFPLPEGRGKFVVSPSSGSTRDAGELKYRTRSLGPTPVGVREIIRDGVVPNQPWWTEPLTGQPGEAPRGASTATGEEGSWSFSPLMDLLRGFFTGGKAQP